MNQADGALDKLRGEIDAIDAEIHDLLMRRTAVVEKIRTQKPDDEVKIRPAREAQILRALLTRHKGIFPKPALVRIWREIVSANTAIQGPFSVAVLAQERRGGFFDLARDHYGSATPISSHTTERGVVDAVTRGNAAVGVLPMPAAGDEAPWWPLLAATGKRIPRVVARLPFAPPAKPRSRDEQALVVARIEPEPSGDDRTLLSVETGEHVSGRMIQTALTAVKLPAQPTAKFQDQADPDRWFHLVECENFVADDDSRLGALADKLELPAGAVIMIGGYAVPLSAEDLLGPKGKKS